MSDPSTPPAAETVVNHLGLCVTDLDRARRFYEELFGFELESELAPPDDPTATLLDLEPPLGLRAVYLRLGAFRLELLAYADRSVRRRPDARTMDETGLTHLSFGAEDHRALLDRVESLGGTVLTETDIGVAAFIRDPDGQLIEILPRPTRR
jgi:lactoylglutathione lyase